MEQYEQLIGEVMLHRLPKDILEAMRVMAVLTYPISDQRSLVDQIEIQLREPQKSLPSEKVEALNLVRGLVTARDFPIMTPVSGLEKLLVYFSEPPGEDLLLDLDIPDVRGTLETPPFDPCAHFRSSFIGACADRACNVFVRQYFLHGAALPDAIADGNLEGETCMRQGGYLGSSIRPTIRVMDPSDRIVRRTGRSRRG
jgi:hypothetical protein